MAIPKKNKKLKNYVGKFWLFYVFSECLLFFKK